MKIAIVGSREFKDNNLLRHVLLDEYRNLYEGTIISGGARGVDTWAIDIANELNSLNYEEGQTKLKIKVFVPDWNKYGKIAGFLRNQLIINEADKIIAFWDGKSKGTKHYIDLAIKVGKPIDIYVRK